MTLGTRRWLALALASVGLLTSCGGDEASGTIAEAATARDFYFGIALTDADTTDAEAVVPTHFNYMSTGGVGMKWGALASTVGNYDFTRADAYVNLAERAGVPLRVHTLLWRDRTPSDLEEQIDEASDPEARMREIVTEHFTTVMTRYRGRVDTWEVIYEPLIPLGAEIDPNIFYRTLGPDYLAEVFRLAHELDPDARLCLNEFLWTYAEDDPRVDGLVALVRGLLEDGVPLHVVGIHGAFVGLNPLPDATRFEALIRRLTDLGVEVAITAAQVSVGYFDRETAFDEQAVVFADMTRACIAVEGCRTMTVWGLRDDDTWLDTYPILTRFAPHSPLLFDLTLTPKPAYWAVRDVLRTRR